MEEPKIKVVSKETLKNMIYCFTDGDELGDFGKALAIMCGQIYASATWASLLAQDDEKICLMMRQIAHFAHFCNENVEVIHQLMKTCKLEEFTQAELDEMNQKGL